MEPRHQWRGDRGGDQEPGRGLAEGPGPAQSYGNPGGAGAGDGGAGHRESTAKNPSCSVEGMGQAPGEKQSAPSLGAFSPVSQAADTKTK